MKLLKQLLIPLILFILVLIIGTIFYHNIEGWGYLDSTYFSVVTMTTVGYGDLNPITNIGKIFTMFYIFAGLLTVFYLLSSIGRYLFMQIIREKLIEEGRIKNKHGVIKIKSR